MTSKQLKQKAVEEFEKKVNQIRQQLPQSEADEKITEFGYKTIRGNEFFTVVDFGNIKKFFLSQLDKFYKEGEKAESKRIYFDWECGIRFSEKDEDEIPIEKRNLSELVMVNHLKASKEKLTLTK